MTATESTFAPWDQRELPPAITAGEAARRARAFREIERRLADALEGWSRAVEPRLGEMLARHAGHHRWHASLWDDVLGGGGDGGLDDEAVAAFIDAAIGVPVDAGASVELLTAVYRVLLPRKIAAYTYHLRALGSAAGLTDGRWIELVLRDEHDGVRDGELALQALLGAAGAVERSAARRAELEALVVRAGGIVGPGTLGGTGKEVTAP